MTDQTNITEPIISKQKSPFMIKFLAVIIMVTSSIWFFYYTAVLMYQIYHPLFLESLTIDNIDFTWPITYVSFNMVLSLTSIISTILILRLKIIGVFGLILTTIFLFFNELFFGGLTGLPFLIFHSIFIIIVLLYYSKFRSKKTVVIY